MDRSNILKGFNNHLSEFFDDIIHVFPDDVEIKKAHVSLINLKKMNPKIIIGVWKTYISDKYSNEIDKGDIEYFLNKNYSSDLQDTDYNKEILDKIEKMKNSIKLMQDDSKEKTIKYLQNLNKLCNLYH
jgi:hypothetical protein